MCSHHIICCLALCAVLPGLACRKGTPPGAAASGTAEDYYGDLPADDTTLARVPVSLLLNNPAFVDRKFSLRELELAGTVIKAENDATAGGVPTVWLGAPSVPGGVACRFREASAIQAFAAGRPAVIRGRLQRDFAQSLENCEAVNP